MVIEEVLSQLRKKLPELGLAFGAYAASGEGGKLSPKQLVACLDSIGIDLPEDAMTAFVNVLDSNRDGHISFAELSASLGVSDSSAGSSRGGNGSGASSGAGGGDGGSKTGVSERRRAVVLRPGTSRRIRGM